MHPPKFLIPFQLLRWTTVTVHEIIGTSVFLVPAIIKYCKGGLFGFLYQFRTVQTFAQIHDKPHRFNGMARSYLTTFKAVNQTTVYIYIFNNDTSEFRTVKNFHYFVDASFHCFPQIVLIQ